MTQQNPAARSEVWDPFSALRNALWIGGGQWAGKSTIAQTLARDRLVTEDTVRCARRLGIPVIEVDGTRDANTVADIIANYFHRYIPPPQQH